MLEQVPQELLYLIACDVLGVEPEVEPEPMCAPSRAAFFYPWPVLALALFDSVIYLYRFVLRRWQGEAEFISEGQQDVVAAPVTDRFLVKVDHIDWIEASGNYVNLHGGGVVPVSRRYRQELKERLA